ncbi:hypothetical protein Tco_0513867 [Tanacetum coccineum]
MENGNPPCTLGDYSRPSHEGYQNTIELPRGNNLVPLRSNTIRLMQNECSFHGLWSEDPNQHLKDFLVFVDSLDLNVGNRERTRLRLFQFPFAIKLEIGLNVFPWDPSPLGRISLSVSLLSFSHQEELSNSEVTSRFPHPGIDLWLQVQIFYDHVNPTTRCTIDQSVGGKLHDKNVEESWALIEDLTLYDNESWNDPRDFAKPVKAISLPYDVPNASDRRLIELENQVQRLMEAHLAPKPSVQVNKIASSCDTCSGPHDTQNCMENMYPRISMKQDVIGSLSNPSKIILVTPIIHHGNVTKTLDARLSKFEADFKQQQSKMTNKIDTFLKAINGRMMEALSSDMVKNHKLKLTPPIRFRLLVLTRLKTLTVNKIGTPKPKEPEKALEDEFKDLHLKLLVLEFLAHAPMYNAILDKYVESLELGKNRDLKGDVKFDELFKEYDIGDFSDEEIEEREILE